MGFTSGPGTGSGVIFGVAGFVGFRHSVPLLRWLHQQDLPCLWPFQRLTSLHVWEVGRVIGGLSLLELTLRLVELSSKVIDGSSGLLTFSSSASSFPDLSSGLAICVRPCVLVGCGLRGLRSGLMRWSSRAVSWWSCRLLRLQLGRLLLLPNLLLVHLSEGYDPSACWVEQMHICVNDYVSFAVIINVLRRREILD